MLKNIIPSYKNFIAYLFLIFLSLGGGWALAREMPSFALFKSGGPPHYSTQPVVSSSSNAPLLGANTIADIADAVSPAVVNIDTVSKEPNPMSQFNEDPMFRRFFGGEVPPEYERRGSGSGFIFDSRGYILTNAHVIEGAQDIKVTLKDGRAFVGKVVGQDKGYDIAVVKINASNLPVASLGDSDKLRPGEWVVAIGNPLGRFGHTVTAGIISALGRKNLDVDTEVAFIQTDAAINPGNSGGPLINLQGQVIGINAAIVAGAQGLGFAIPINLVKAHLDELITKGSAVHPWKPKLGVYVQDVTPDIADYLGLPSPKGALVAEVAEDSVAAKAGIHRGDVIWKFGNTKIDSPQQLVDQVKTVKQGAVVEVKLYRQGQVKTVTIRFE